MTSSIDPTVPVEVDPTTQSVRDNFGHAHDEITALQAQVQVLYTELASHGNSFLCSSSYGGLHNWSAWQSAGLMMPASPFQNSAGTYDQAGGSLTVSAPGRYSVWVHLSPTSNGSAPAVRVKRNGVVTDTKTGVSFSTVQQLVIATTMDLLQGDVLSFEVQAVNNAGWSLSLDAFQVRRI